MKSLLNADFKNLLMEMLYLVLTSEGALLSACSRNARDARMGEPGLRFFASILAASCNSTPRKRRRKRRKRRRKRRRVARPLRRRHEPKNENRV